MIDHTHDANAKSWVADGTGWNDFPIQNLPWGVCSKHGIVVAIGDQAVVLRKAIEQNKLQFADEISVALQADSLNDFMSLGHEVWTLVRHALFELLCGEPAPEILCQQSDLLLIMPAKIGDYTDFYAARNHATNVGKMFRPDGDPLMPNYLHLPVGYHGRASSIVITGTEIIRPHGQLKPDDGAPIFAPCKLLDYELEFGAFIGTGNNMGERIAMDASMEHLFGIVILNDWSARDVQKWEYQPLGPTWSNQYARMSLASAITPLPSHQNHTPVMRIVTTSSISIKGFRTLHIIFIFIFGIFRNGIGVFNVNLLRHFHRKMRCCRSHVGISNGVIIIVFRINGCALRHAVGHIGG